MKNKKLFAILTLVCFMFTLMPVAAFAADSYAEVDSEYDIVKLEYTVDTNSDGEADADAKAKVKFVTTGDIANEEKFVYAVKADGTLYTGLTRNGGTATGTEGVVLFGSGAAKNVFFADPGEYTLFVTPATDAMKTIVENKTVVRVKSQILALLLDEKVTMLDNKVTIKPVDSNYTLTLAGEATEVKNDEGEVTGYTVDVDANSGYATKTIKATLTNNGNPVVGATLKVSTNSSAVDVNKTEVTTNAAGIATFKVSASTAGDFKVYVEYGTKTDVTLNVNAGTLDPAKITNIYAPAIPLALDSTMSGTEFTYTIVDANGNNIEGQFDKSGNTVAPMVKDTNYKVVVTEKPAGSSLDGDDDIVLSYDPTSATWYLDGDATFDEEGDYTIKITLDNGNYATASVTVKEFQTPVELKMTYKQEAVELNGEAVLNKLYYVDANGVKKNVKDKVDGEVVLSATGYAIADFEADNENNKAGLVTVKADEKYVGSVITVLAVSDKYNLTASVELVVANEAVAVKYATTTADVAVNNTLTANIVDQDGKKVALKDAVAKNAKISYVVLAQPEGSKVAISTLSNELAAKGQFKVSFTASEIGTYKVQTVVRYEQAGSTVTDNAVIKYYTGIEEITVGNTGFEDIVVMSVGSNEIVVNAETKAIDAAPMISNNRTFVPFRALAEAFGATVAYDEATQAVTAELNGTTVVMTIGSATYTVNGVEKTADVAPFISDSRTMVPVRFVAEEFGIKVTPTYDENGATADILFAK